MVSESDSTGWRGKYAWLYQNTRIEMVYSGLLLKDGYSCRVWTMRIELSTFQLGIEVEFVELSRI